MSDSGSILKNVRSPSIVGQPPLVPPVGAPPAGASPVVPPQPAQPNRLFDTHNISGLPTAPRKKGFFSRLRGLWVTCPDIDTSSPFLLYCTTPILRMNHIYLSYGRLRSTSPSISLALSRCWLVAVAHFKNLRWCEYYRTAWVWLSRESLNRVHWNQQHTRGWWRGGRWGMIQRYQTKANCKKKPKITIFPLVTNHPLLDLNSWFLLVFCKDVAQPIKSFIQPISCSGTTCLHIPCDVCGEGMKFQFLGQFGDGEGVGEILFVCIDQKVRSWQGVIQYGSE